MAKFDLWPLKNDLENDSTKSISWQFIKGTPMKLHAKNEKKLLKRFWEIGTFKQKLTPTTDGRTDDRRTDDGQVGIRKAPLPDGKAELKSYWSVSEKL